MDKRISQIRKVIRARRVSMREPKPSARTINRDEDCTLVALEIMKMRTVMSELVVERSELGNNEPILVQSQFSPRPAPAPHILRTVILCRQRRISSTDRPRMEWTTFDGFRLRGRWRKTSTASA